jgi:glycosyltransferase involved in cell wall biosynthesis
VRVGLELTILELSRTGGARAARALADALAAEPGVEVVPLAQPRAPAPAAGRMARGLAREGVWMPHRVRRRAQRERVDVLHLPAALSPPVGNGLPVALTVHDTFAWHHPAWTSRPVRLQHRLRVTPSLGHVAVVIVPSRYTAGCVTDLGVAPEAVHVTPYGVGEPFGPGEPSEAVLRALGVERPFLLGLWSTSPRKNLAGLLDAYAILAGAGAEHALALAGDDGPRDRGLERRAASMRGVRRLGWVSDQQLAELYRGAAAFVFPTLGEGFGLPVAEAMACGVPVVSTTAGSIPEVAGDAALLVDPSDTVALVAGVRDVLDSPALRDRLVDRGRGRAAELSWRRTAELTAEAYRRALERAA